MIEILFVKRIKELMEENRINQAQLAKGLNMTETAVSYWVNEKREPSISSLWLLADFFDVSVDYLIGREN